MDFNGELIDDWVALLERLYPRPAIMGVWIVFPWSIPQNNIRFILITSLSF